MMTNPITLKLNNESINGILENPEGKKMMVLVHGFTGDLRGPAGIFEKLSRELQKLGYAVLRFSLRGTPPSEGEFADMTVASETEDLKEVIRYARSLGYGEIGVLGESMGGTIAVTAYDPLIKLVVLWYSAFDFADTDFKALFFSEAAQKEIAENGCFLCDGFEVGKAFINECLSINVYDDLAKIECPTLLLHGDMDSDVPYGQSEKAYRLLAGPKEIKILSGAEHCFKDEQEEAIALTIDFVKRYL